MEEHRGERTVELKGRGLGRERTEKLRDRHLRGSGQRDIGDLGRTDRGAVYG